MTTASLTGTDVRLRDAIIRQLDWDPEVDDSAVGVAAKDGVATLTGFIRGVHGVLNHIDVSPKTTQRDVRRRIIQALHRNADVDARHIDVAVGDDDVVILTGTVESWSQRDAAERAAGSAPGIRNVDNRIIVEPSESYELEPPDEIC